MTLTVNVPMSTKTPPLPPPNPTNKKRLIDFVSSNYAELENIRFGNKTLWFKVNILPSNI